MENQYDGQKNVQPFWNTHIYLYNRFFSLSLSLSRKKTLKAMEVREINIHFQYVGF